MGWQERKSRGSDEKFEDRAGAWVGRPAPRHAGAEGVSGRLGGSCAWGGAQAGSRRRWTRAGGAKMAWGFWRRVPCLRMGEWTQAGFGGARGQMRKAG